MAYLKKTALHIALAALFAPQVFFYSTRAIAQTQILPSITVEGKSAPVLEPERAEVGGFDVRVKALAQSVSVIGKDALYETALTTLSQITRLDASLADAYNTTGYNQSLTLRGFVLDNFYNFRRDGLPVLNVGPLALENKLQIEVLKGVSGMLSGISAPGGLVDSVVKRASNDWASSAQFSTGERGSLGVAMDVGGRAAQGLGVQLHASANNLRPEIENAKGARQFVSGAFDYKLGVTTLALDLEWQNFKQPSVPGISPLDRNGDGVGDALPAAQSRRNLNAQPWSQPFETRATLGALKLTHALNSDWTTKAAAQRQQVRTNDRIAFPDGCSSGAVYVYPGFCGNGDYDLYDFRSDNEKRTLDVFDANVRGKFGGATFTLGAQQRNLTQRTQAQAYNYVGTNNLNSAPQVLPSDPSTPIAGTNLSERSAEIYANAHAKITEQLAAFGGVRVTNLHRKSIRTDGGEAASVAQTITSPWLGVSFALTPALNLYASWGQGAESEIVPNRPAQYTNYGAVLPALKSTQLEIGSKWQAAPRLLFTAAAFEINKPFGDDVPAAQNLFTRVAGVKEAKHRGVEIAAVGKIAPQVSVQWSATMLDATFVRANDEALVGKRVTNVPKLASSIFLYYQPSFISGLGLNALVSAQSRKAVTANNALEIAGGAQLDFGLRYAHNFNTQRLTWRLNVENVTDRQAWREAPTQPWGGIYLLPTPARALRASVAMGW